MLDTSTTKLSRKERKRAREEKRNQQVNLEMRTVKPITSNQRKAFDSFWSGKNMMLHGCAGVGKTYIAIYLGLQAILTDKAYDRLLIVRSVVPTRDMGFLPGNQQEKMKVYEAPYYAICTELFGRGDAYEVLKSKDIVKFISTSFVRGINFENCVVVVDEIQNLTFHEADSIITRTSKNCRLIYSGDIRQSDLNKGREKSGLRDFMEIIKRMKSFDMIEFDTSDICRSSLVKDYIMIRNQLEDRDIINPNGEWR